MADGRLTAYDPDIDFEDELVPEDDAAVDEEDIAEISPATMEFALEAHLEEFLVGNWSAVNLGLPAEAPLSLTGLLTSDELRHK